MVVVASKWDTASRKDMKKKGGGGATEGLNIQLTILILLKLFKEKQNIFCRQFEGE